MKVVLGGEREMQEGGWPGRRDSSGMASSGQQLWEVWHASEVGDRWR
jgi:hypothetical protein